VYRLDLDPRISRGLFAVIFTSSVALLSLCSNLYKAPEIAEDLRGNSAALLSQKDPSSAGVSLRALNCDQPEARAPVSRIVANALHIAAHDVAIEIKLAGIRTHGLTFFKSNCQKGYGVRKRDRAAQIAKRFERPQEGLNNPLVTERYRFALWHVLVRAS
jgi:hypothetical protein